MAEPDALLLVIDLQPCFMPGGALAVAGGDAIIPLVNRLLGRFSQAVATQDWHPADHLSFASQHPGRRPFDTIAMPYGEQVLWPDHAVQGTAGAALHPALQADCCQLVLRKGFRRDIDSYSAFFENDRRTPTGLEGYLRNRGIGSLFLCGLATDYCVAYSAEDAARLGFAVTVIEDACRGIGLPLPDGTTTMQAARARMAAAGVRFTTAAMLA